MKRCSNDRAIWLAQHVLPLERGLRAWLGRKQLGTIEHDDIIQEIYTRLITVDSVEHIRDVGSYVFQIAGSVIVDTLRRQKIISIAAFPERNYLEVVSQAPSPETCVIDRDEWQHLTMAISRLPGNIRKAFVLSRIYGLSQREVADRLGLSESTVEKHIRKGFLLVLASIKRNDGAAGEEENTSGAASEENPILTRRALKDRH
jgi:RNA polymerase sigma factor (sigma-70 family)